MADHPTTAELSGFVLGTLPLESSDALADHIEKCTACQDTVCQLDTHKDTLLNGLLVPLPPIDESCRRAVDKVVAIAAGQSAEPSVTVSQVWFLEPSSEVKPVTSREQFLAALLQLGIVGEQDWDALLKLPAVASAVDAAALGRALVENGTLTEFQAQMIGRGQAPGLLFGEYLILDRLGTGGMGQVFKVRHRRMDRVVAVKVLSRAMLHAPNAAKRFEREVKAAARLIHPNIVTAFDAGVVNGQHFLVMQYVAGSDLSALAKQHGPLPIDKVIDYVRQAACGLAFAHSQGVVHRDIKPANLLVDAEGVVRILDMGLARLDCDAAVGNAGSSATGDGLTLTGQVMGSVDYMAPEQAADIRTADARADVYSLGCTLHRLLVGQLMFSGQSLVQKVLAHREQAIPSLCSVRPDVPARLDAIYRRMVAKKPEDRPTMAELVVELAALAAGDLAVAPIDGQSRAPVATHPKPATAVPSHSHTPEDQLGGNRKPPFRRLVAAAAGFLLVCLGAWVIVRDKDGNVVARVGVPAGGSVAMDADKSLPAGDGERQPVNDVALPGKVQAPVVAAGDPDRRAAAWARSVNGRIKIRVDGESDEISVDELPRDPFALTHVDLFGNYDEVRDVGLASFQGCQNLTYLELTLTKVTDAGLVYFKDCKHLEHLGLDQTAVSDAGVAHFKNCKDLKVLVLSRTRVSDAGLAYFKDCTGLKELYLEGIDISSKGLAYFKDRQELEVLHLTGPRINDAGMVHFRNCKNLSTLYLNLTRVGDAGLDQFKQCSGLKSLSVGSSRVTGAALARLADWPNLTFLNLMNQPVSDADLEHLSDGKQLTELHLGSDTITDAGLACLPRCKQLTTLELLVSGTDAGLKYLETLSNLSSLNLKGMKGISAAGVWKLAAALPQCKIEWDGGVIEPSEAETPQGE